MLWKNRGDRPATRSGGGRRHSVVEETETGSEIPAGHDGLSTNSIDNLALRQTHSIGSLPFEPDQQSAGSRSATQHWPEPQEASQSQEQIGTRLQPNKNSRFSLMRFRHASDPQLSATFAAGNTSPPPNLPSEYSVLWPSLTFSIPAC
jgi:hypothetical protein